MLPGVELTENIVTYEQQILDAALPESIVVIGAGGIGMEFAYILNSYGVDVQILEYADRALPNEDAEVSKEVDPSVPAPRHPHPHLHPRGLRRRPRRPRRHHSHRPHGQTSRSRRVAHSSASDSVPTPNTSASNTVGVQLAPDGAIDIDDYMRSSMPHIYAVGDVTAKVQLAHVASAQGVVAAETIAGAETMPLDYRMMPRVTFCQPQVAAFGYTEVQARAAGLDIRVATFPMQASAKAHGLGEPGGFIKLIADSAHGELLGAHLVGAEVSELLPELTAAQLWDLTATELARNVHTHPTLGEGLQECFHALIGHAINL